LWTSPPIEDAFLHPYFTFGETPSVAALQAASGYLPFGQIPARGARLLRLEVVDVHGLYPSEFKYKKNIISTWQWAMAIAGWLAEPESRL
jgi:hypothetical protein